jgi:hypothetical protein
MDFSQSFTQTEIDTDLIDTDMVDFGGRVAAIASIEDDACIREDRIGDICRTLGLQASC